MDVRQCGCVPGQTFGITALPLQGLYNYAQGIDLIHDGQLSEPRMQGAAPAPSRNERRESQPTSAIHPRDLQLTP